MKISGCLPLAVLTVLSGFVKSEPVRGGYENSIQNVGGYGEPSGYGGSSGYGNEPANYDFQYEVFGGGNFFGHQESRRDQTATGKYHVLLPDGRRQIVDYIADESGYHPTVTYELVADPFSGGYGNSKGNKGSSGGYGAPKGNPSYGVPKGSAGGYEDPSKETPGGYEGPKGTPGGYGAPVSDNSLGGYSAPEQGGRYSSRIKRQFLIASPLDDHSDDIVRIYKSEKNPEQIFRNRRRRFSPKKTYLIVYPNLQTSTTEDKSSI